MKLSKVLTTVICAGATIFMMMGCGSDDGNACAESCKKAMALNDCKPAESQEKCEADCNKAIDEEKDCKDEMSAMAECAAKGDYVCEGSDLKSTAKCDDQIAKYTECKLKAMPEK